jgi:hypothetical protein
MSRNWFWGTLILWSLLGAGATSWALILSPRVSNPSIVSFDARLNGEWTHHRIERSRLPLPEAAEATSRHWEKAGWSSLQGPLPLAPLLLGLAGEDPRIARYLRIDLFKRAKDLKIIGSWEKEGSTYHWTVGIPDSLAPKSKKETFIDFPLPPPMDGIHAFRGSWKGLEMACWSIPSSIDPSSTFRRYCRSMGFQCHYQSPSGSTRTAMVQKGSRRMLAILEKNGDLDTVILMDLSGSEAPPFPSVRSDGSVPSKEE